MRRDAQLTLLAVVISLAGSGALVTTPPAWDGTSLLWQAAFFVCVAITIGGLVWLFVLLWRGRGDSDARPFIDARQIGKGDLTSNTFMGKGEVIKSKKVGELSMKDNIVERGPEETSKPLTKGRFDK